MATGKNYYKVNDLKPQKFILSQSGRQRAKIKVAQGWAPSRGPRETFPSLLMPLTVSGSPWLVAASLQSLPLLSCGRLLHVCVSLPPRGHRPP